MGPLCGRGLGLNGRRLDATLPEGAKVRVESLEPEPDRRALVEELRAIARSMPELPPERASQHDHYLCGTAKR